MKVGSLASCIILLTLVLFVLSMGAQATEYREVKAKEVLEQIESGKDVNLTGCRIVGELNTSEIKLETVPNPYFYKLVKEGNYKETLISLGYCENLHVIGNKITIKESIIENGSNFSGVLFKNTVIF
jgi:hypothetical protein